MSDNKEQGKLVFPKKKELIDTIKEMDDDV